MKKILIYCSTISTVLFIIGCGDIQLLDSKSKELYSADFPNKDHKIKVVYTPSNATVQSYIQVRKQNKNKEEIIAAFERYNYMDTCKFIDDTTFMLVIRDTISLLGNKPDTMRIILK